MGNRTYNAIGVVEVNFFANALIVLDEMLKASEVHLVACEKTLGGRMVSIIVGGDTSAVNAAIEAALLTRQVVGEKNIKVAVTISNPHIEIRKLFNLSQKPNQSQMKEIQEQTLQTQEQKALTVKTAIVANPKKQKAKTKANNNRAEK